MSGIPPDEHELVTRRGAGRAEDAGAAMEAVAAVIEAGFGER